MPPKRSRYEVEEYVPAAPNPHREARPVVTGRHTQYEMVDASRSSRVKTVLSIEHEAAPTPAILEDDISPHFMEVDYDYNEGPDNGHDDSGRDDDKDRELEAAGLEEIRMPEVIRSKRVRRTHTVSHILDHPALAYLPSA
jgi:hypothetical protein